MSKLPRVALPANDLAKSIAFYVDTLGFASGERPANDMAQVVEPGPDGGIILLYGPQAGDLTPYLNEQHFILKAGEMLRFARPDLDAFSATLKERGLDDLKIVETRSGDRVLDVKDPTGSILRFISRAQITPQKSLELYLSSVDELENAVAGLSEADLDLAATEDSWSIRQIVHHLADGELLFGGWMKFMLLAPGQMYTLNFPPGGNDAISDTQQNGKRGITPSLALIRASREHLVQVAQYIPDAWERSTSDKNGNTRSFGQLVSLLVGHTFEHIEEIQAIRNAARS